MSEAPRDDAELVALPTARRWPARLAWLLVLAALAAAGVALRRRYLAANAPAPPRTVRVRRGPLVQSALATGRVVPRQELFVRPLVSGLLTELRVQAGERVRAGQHVATVRIVADPVALEDARGQVRLAQVRLERAARELARLSAMRARGLSSAQELASAESDARLAREEVATLRSRATLLERGSARGGSARSTRVLAPIDGTVLAVPVTLGDYVSETTAFRDGTTLFSVADLGDLLFKGQLEEAYVGQLRLGMPVRVRVGALPGRTLAGTLRWVAPRASVESATVSAPVANGFVPQLAASTVGVTRFELWASLEGSGEAVAGLRAGYSATGEIELARRERALLLDEGVLRFEGERAFALRCGAGDEVALPVGLSDGVAIELLEGVAAGLAVREGDCFLARGP